MVSDPVALCQTPLKQTLMDLLEDISMDARELGCAHWLNPLKQGIAGNAGDAAWLRASEKLHGNLNDVVREASEQLMGKNNQIQEKSK
jgi:glutamate---cysteine ligase / carboxylate-amine ligase